MIRFLAALVEDRRLATATAGALLVAGGAVAPWASIRSPLRPLTELGLDADGKITLLCGVAALGLIVAYTRLRQVDLLAAAALAGAIALGFAVIYEINLVRASSRVLGRVLDVAPGAVSAEFGVRTGLGIWLSIAGAALLIATATAIALTGRRGREQSAESTTEPT